MKYSGRLDEQALTLRPISSQDIEMVRGWRNGENTRKWFINEEEITEEQQKKWYESYLENDQEIIFIIEEKQLFHQPIGVVSLYNIDRNLLQAEFGRMFIGLEAARGKGYGALATKMICGFGFHYYKLKKIYLNVLKNNYSAMNAYKKIGFKEVKEVNEEGKILIHMILLPEQNGHAKTKVLALCFKRIPSAIVGVIEPLKKLELKDKLEFQYKNTQDVNEIDITSSDVIICVRGAEIRELELVQKAKNEGKYVIYFLDDDLLNIDESDIYSQKYFNNPIIINNIRSIMGNSNALWTTNAMIGAKYSHLFEKTIVTDAPALLLSDEAVENKKVNHIITIGYAGGIHHRSFFEHILYNPMERLLKEYAGKIKIEVLGFEPYYMHQFTIDFFPYIDDYKQYKEFMLNRNWDIGLAPFPNSAFHSCKYFNKYLEYGAIKAAGIYSNVSPFTNRIKNEKNGLMVNNTVDDWYHGMVRLIENETLRKKLIDAAEADVRENFSLDSICEDIIAKIYELGNYKT